MDAAKSKSTSFVFGEKKKKEKTKKKKKEDKNGNPDFLSQANYVKYRREQLSGVENAYPNKFHVSHSLREVASRFGPRLREGESDEAAEVAVSGRVRGIRPAGRNLYFVDLERDEHQLQVNGL